MEEESTRNLTDNDVQALVDELEKRWERRFYLNLGRGVWSILWRAFIAAMLIVAGWGAFKDGRFF